MGINQVEKKQEAADNNSDSSSDSVNQDVIAKERQTNKHKVKSEIKSQTSHLIAIVILDIITLLFLYLSITQLYQPPTETWTDGTCSDKAYNQDESTCLTAGTCSDTQYDNDETNCLNNSGSWTPENTWTYGTCSDKESKDQNTCEKTWIDGLIIAGLLSQFIFKLVVIFKYSTTNDLIKNIMQNSSACDQIDKIRQTRPEPRQGIQGQHDIQAGGSKTKKSQSQTKIKQLNYKYWADWSPEIQKALSKYQFTAIFIDKKLIFFDKNTEKQYNKLKGKVISENKNRDTHYDQLENFRVKGFDQCKLACRNLQDLPCYFNCCVWVLSCLTITSPMQYLFWSQVATIDYTLFKVISTKAKINLDINDDGEGDLASDSASDKTCGCSYQDWSDLAKGQIFEGEFCYCCPK